MAVEDMDNHQERITALNAAVLSVLGIGDAYPDGFDCVRCGGHVFEHCHPYAPVCLRCTVEARRAARAAERVHG